MKLPQNEAKTYPLAQFFQQFCYISYIKVLPHISERWSGNRIIEGNMQGGLFFSDFIMMPSKYP